MAKNQANPNSEIAKFVGAARAAMGLTQAEFGEKFDRTKQNANHWEAGRHEPSFALLRAMSDVSGVPLPASVKPDWLTTGEGEMLAATLSATLTAPAMLMSASGGPTLLGVGTQSIAGLGAALAYVASTMLMADDLVKIQAKPLLALLIEKPEQAEKIIPRLVALLEGDFLTTETKDFIHAKQPS